MGLGYQWCRNGLPWISTEDLKGSGLMAFEGEAKLLAEGPTGEMFVEGGLLTVTVSLQMRALF